MGLPCVRLIGTDRATLIEVAGRLVRRREPAFGLAMVQTSNTDRRLAWIDRIRGGLRCRLRWPARLAPAIIMMAVFGMLAAIEVSRAAVKAAERPEANPTAPRTIDVIVRAKDTGQPIEGASVRATMDVERVVRKTGRDGRARIILFRRAPRFVLWIDAWAEGYVQQRHSFSQTDARYPKIPQEIAVDLLPGEQTLGGAVTDEQGRPIKGVRAEIWGHLGEKKQSNELAVKVDATTDDRGRWRCRCFRDMKFAYLYLSHTDYLSDDAWHPRAHGQPDPSIPAQVGDRPLQALLDFSDVQVMTRGVEVRGEVRDERGTPIEGAEVGWFEADRNDTTHRDITITKTDDRGGFQFPHARPGRLVLQAKAKGHAPGLKRIEAVAGAGPVAIMLGPAHRLEGRVVDSRGKPIPEAFVAVDEWRTYHALGVFLETDADGRFRWEDAPADQVRINAQRIGYNLLIGRRATVGDEIVLTLRRSLSISGRVRDGATREPIAQAEVELGVAGPGIHGLRWVKMPRTFAIQGLLQAEIDVERWPEFRLRLRAKGYEPFESRTFRGEEVQVKYDVPMRKADKP